MLIKGFQKIWESNFLFFIFGTNGNIHCKKKNKNSYCVFDAMKMYNTKFEKWFLQGGLPPLPRLYDTNFFVQNSKNLEKLVKFRLQKKTFLQDFPKILVKKDNCFVLKITDASFY
jgi:hypothetical protein